MTSCASGQTFSCKSADPDGKPTIYVNRTDAAGKQYPVIVETFKNQDKAEKRCIQLRKQWVNLYNPKSKRKK